MLAYVYSSDEDENQLSETGKNTDKKNSIKNETLSFPTRSVAPVFPPNSSIKAYEPLKLNFRPEFPVQFVDDSFSYEGNLLTRLERNTSGDEIVPKTKLKEVKEFSVDYRSLPKSFSQKFKKPNEKSDTDFQKRKSGSNFTSNDALSDMDQLDNLFMDKSLQTGFSSTDEKLKREQYGSENSTYKPSESGKLIDGEFSKAIDRFSLVLQQLQHHTLDLNNENKKIEYEVKNSKSEITKLQKCFESINSDVINLKAEFSAMRQEALHHRVKYDFECKEIDGLRQELSCMLYEAQTAKKNYENSKSYYEVTIKDLRSIIEHVRSSFFINEEVRSKETKHEHRKKEEKDKFRHNYEQQHDKTQLQTQYEENKKYYKKNIAENVHIEREDNLRKNRSTEKSFSDSDNQGVKTNNKQQRTRRKSNHGKESTLEKREKLISGEHKENLETKISHTNGERHTNKSTERRKTSAANVGKSYSESDNSSKSSSNKGISSSKQYYQSFLQNTSGFLLSLTPSWSQIKKKGKEINSADNITKSSEPEKKTENFELIQNGVQKNCDKVIKTESRSVEMRRKPKLKTGEHYRKSVDIATSNKGLASFSTENLPMMDDSVETEAKNLSSIQNGDHRFPYALKKSISSPLVTTQMQFEKYLKEKIEFPKPLINDSFSPLPEEYNTPPALRENKNQVRSYYKLYHPLGSEVRPLSISSIDEDEPLRTIAQEPEVPMRARKRSYAITKQKSSPNIPMHKQHSAMMMYPIQRQHSLGMVPEEGQFPRQDSMMSIMEDRPITDQTLPMSPVQSMLSICLSPSHSREGLNFFSQTQPRENLSSERVQARNSMELVTGSVIAGSQFQEMGHRDLPPFDELDKMAPIATSSLKRKKTKDTSTKDS